MLSNRTRWTLIALAACLALGPAASLFAHCQIPCGIFDDGIRFTEMLEDVTTIEKSMNQINELSGDKANFNQSVRWVMNKEEHANKLTETITYYFMAQRIKAPANDDAAANEKYNKELRLMHGIMVHAMKAKQTTDTGHCEQLRDLIGQLKKSYMAGHEH